MKQIGLIFGLIISLIIIYPSIFSHADATNGTVVTLHRINVYSNRQFKNARIVGSYKKHERVSIDTIVTNGGINRFKLLNGHYITANKKYVKLIKSSLN